MSIVFAFLSILILLGHSNLCRAGTDDRPLVHTKYGPLQGISVKFGEKQVDLFLGIPYAKPPISDLRFERPQSPEPWTDPLDASSHRSACIQSPFAKILIDLNVPTSEDCLYLNVFAPATSSNPQESLPVLIWIHGGGLIVGSAAQPEYNATALAALGNVIVVTINFRLGPLGFLHTGGSEADIRGNIGLWDQNLAIRWTKENIASFGGDPEKITIFGESAGGWSVSSHVVSPRSHHLIKGAIIQSGALTSSANVCPARAKRMSREFAATVGCTSTDAAELKTCLKKVPSDKFSTSFFDKEFAPIVFGDADTDDESFLPRSAREVLESGRFPQDLNIMTGITSNEGSIMLAHASPMAFHPINPAPLDKMTVVEVIEQVSQDPHLASLAINFYLKSVNHDDSDELRQRLSQFAGDLFLSCPTIMFGEEYARTVKSKGGKGNVYSYVVDQKPTTSMFPVCRGGDWMATCHGDDLVYIFGLPFVEPEKYTDEDRRMSTLMIRIWSTFARERHPGKLGIDSNDGQDWPAIEADRNEVVSNIVDLKVRGSAPGSQLSVLVDPYKARCRQLMKRFLHQC